MAVNDCFNATELREYYRDYGRWMWRTHYLVIPRIALEAMPEKWRNEFAELMAQMDEANIEIPEYFVFRGGNDRFTCAKVVNERTGFVRLVKGDADPWSDYRHGNIKELCPNLKLNGGKDDKKN